MVQAGLTHEPPRRTTVEVDWRVEYARQFGKPPHHRMKPETIRQKVEAHRGNIG